MHSRIRTAILALCVLFSGIAAGNTPEELTQHYYQYIKNRQWENLANIMDDDALREFKQSILPLFEQEASRKQSLLLEKLYGKDSTLEQAKKSGDREFFQRAIQNVVELMKNTPYRVLDTRILGTVTEGDAITHVMVKETITTGNYNTPNIEVFSFKKSKDRWQLMLSGKLANFVQTARFNSEHAR